MNFYQDHRKLFAGAGGLFVGLTLLICVIPAFHVENEYKPLPTATPLTAQEMHGKQIYIREGCIACHTQQVRNIDMDDVFGKRPSIAADYAMNRRMDFFRNSTNLMGSERTGPDLTNVGERQPSLDWQYSHLFNPRSVVPQSIMPSFRWLFKIKEQLSTGDSDVKIPDAIRKEMGVQKEQHIVPTQDAKDLVAYLLSLKQAELPKAIPAGEFLYKPAKTASASGGGAAKGPDGAKLFAANCATCHQIGGTGVPGAFPPLKGNSVVLGDNIELYVTIIMKGYDGLAPAYGPMPPVGTTANFKPEDVAAIMNHERSSWGNNAKPVTVDEVKKIMDKIK